MLRNNATIICPNCVCHDIHPVHQRGNDPVLPPGHRQGAAGIAPRPQQSEGAGTARLPPAPSVVISPQTRTPAMPSGAIQLQESLTIQEIIAFCISVKVTQRKTHFTRTTRLQHPRVPGGDTASTGLAQPGQGDAAQLGTTAHTSRARLGLTAHVSSHSNNQFLANAQRATDTEKIHQGENAGAAAWSPTDQNPSTGAWLRLHRHQVQTTWCANTPPQKAES